MVIPVLFFILGLILLIKGGDWFVDSASEIAKKLRIPDILIGATVVSVGTTLPEVMVSATSAFSGHGEMAYGNAIGSIICNTALIAALTVAIRPARIEPRSFSLHVIVFFIAAAVYVAVAYVFGEFTRPVGILLLIIFVAYIVLSVRSAQKSYQDNKEESYEESGEKSKISKNIFLLILGAAVIAIGADLLVDNGTLIAQKMGVPEFVIALTFIAIGTSLPELVTAVTSLVKGHGALSLGNVIGANILNLLLVNGTASVISPFSVPNSKQVFGLNSSFVIDIPVMLFVMAFLTLPALLTKKLTRIQGIILITVYLVFCAVQFVV